MLENKGSFQPLAVLKDVVANEMCVGCGVCIAQSGVSREAEMKWNELGFLVPDLEKVESLPAISLAVCPFNPQPDKEVRTEDELAEVFLSKSPKKYEKIGRYFNIYVGHSETFRMTSSSGGVASYVIYRLLQDNVVNAVLSVGVGDKEGIPYSYTILNAAEDILKGSKTRYYPVSMADVLKKLETIEGKVAVVGIPCFIKAIRLHQHYNPSIKDKISFLIGIVCGGMKSSFFASYLASKAGLSSSLFYKPEFRVKDIHSWALDYSYSCEDAEERVYTIKMSTVGDMWGTGYFKNNACDYCDDVSAELADITLGDAWIDPYKQDGRGTNVAITRSAAADALIKDGISRGELNLENLSEEMFIQSQQGGYNHRHKGMKYRMLHAKKKNKQIAPKRYDQENISLDFRLVQKARMRVRALSLVNWKDNSNAISFDKLMYKPLEQLRFYTRLYHKINSIKRRLKGNKR